MTTSDISDFAARLLGWFDREGRHDLPWQRPRTPYLVWLAEVMLQQTQVATVVPYFKRFVARFPDFAALAAAHIDEVLALWAGLGYYARGRNLHAAARLIVAQHGGKMPTDLEVVQALPGIGRSTAAAILAQAYGQRQAILDGNVKRVLARHAAVRGWPGDRVVANQLWAISEQLLPERRLADYTQAIMDLGATLCTSRAPACGRCPVAADCVARLQDRIRELPGSRPKRARSSREARLLLVENEAGELLIERRPPAGIWGGLWCLPLAEPGEDVDALLRGRYGLRAQARGEALPVIRHAFTHFEFALTPLRLRVIPDGAASVREHEARRWIDVRDATLPGLPTPVTQFLTHLRVAKVTHLESFNPHSSAIETGASSTSSAAKPGNKRSPDSTRG